MDGMNRKDEIKYKISKCKDKTWDIILDLQRKLYEQFDLTDD